MPTRHILLLLSLSLVHGYRFAVGDRVECHLSQDTWEPGTVAELQVEHNGQLAPFLVQLDSGSSVVAPHDDDRFIRQEGSRSSRTSARLLRFSIGTPVEANLGQYWERGTVSQVNYHNPSFGKDVYMPYEVKLDSGGSVFAPHDDDSVIRKAGSIRMTDPALRFGVGDRVECLYQEDDGTQHWEPGRIVALHYHEERFGEGVTMPYQVKLDAAERLIFTPKDSEDLIRSAARSIANANQPKRQQALPNLPPAAKSRMGRARIGRQASTIGTRSSGSKLGSSKLGRSARARAHKSALPEPSSRGKEALDFWRTAAGDLGDD